VSIHETIGVATMIIVRAGSDDLIAFLERFPAGITNGVFHPLPEDIPQEASGQFLALALLCGSFRIFGFDDIESDLYLFDRDERIFTE
jgi:hypothetical protein